MAIWLLLTWSLEVEAVIAGAFFSLLIAVLFGDVFPKNAGMVADPRRWFWMAVYVPYFLFYCAKANLDPEPSPLTSSIRIITFTGFAFPRVTRSSIQRRSWAALSG